MKKVILLIVRITVIVLAFYLVFRKLSLQDLLQAWRSIHAVWLIPALLLYNLSQFTSARRLQHFYHAIRVNISFQSNLLLYYKAMFYGLFLPGGISGDAYKVIRLKRVSTVSNRSLITATFLDRATGLMVLVILIALLLIRVLEIRYTWLLWTGTVLIIIAVTVLAAWLIRRYMAEFSLAAVTGAGLSVLIQFLQLASFFCILQSMSTPVHQWLSYALLFYLGSVLSAVPVSIGGIGIREWVFATGSGWLGLAASTAVTASLLFFLLAAGSALVAAFLPDPALHPSGGTRRVAPDG
ncbi:lysylphosphatidylglycerol synthase transmembrane domain-containing protein [Flavihumibacter stibioxidans]|uniref:Flippase-like domain-containing protein n=1 Tax=Flavihumibacter stibioxidans TaxID=1834163 RepID=A0ABR7M6D0_9BACT|nr:lysylphosphatidylglycerol synthase transmembrane domain-containing protein [Flavihumibacter stibioxidans]MBC6490595.1 hypothetical protein [Flavihumibacter stibioxidans]